MCVSVCSLATVAGEAVRMVRVPQSSYNPALHKVATRLALCAVQIVIVRTAVVVSLLHEVAT